MKHDELDRVVNALRPATVDELADAAYERRPDAALVRARAGDVRPEPASGPDTVACPCPRRDRGGGGGGGTGQPARCPAVTVVAATDRAEPAVPVRSCWPARRRPPGSPPPTGPAGTPAPACGRTWCPSSSAPASRLPRWSAAVRSRHGPRAAPRTGGAPCRAGPACGSVRTCRWTSGSPSPPRRTRRPGRRRALRRSTSTAARRPPSRTRSRTTRAPTW